LQLPDFQHNAVKRRSKDWLLKLVSKSDGNYEVWILRSWTDEAVSGSDYKYIEILVYSTAEKEWKTVSARINDIKAIVGELFVGKDGSIWARNYGGDFITIFEPPFQVGISVYSQDPQSLSMPSLSKYDEQNARFEPQSNTGGMISTKIGVEQNKVLFADNGIFWFFVQNDGIYSYSPVTQTTKRYADLPENKLVGSIALASDGSIFFSDGFSSVYRFFPSTGDIKKIGGTPLPFDNALPSTFRDILVDHTNRLWLGNVGWVEPDEYTTWYQLVPSPVFITDKVDNLPIRQWEKPRLILESSDGLLWYKSSNGMVWLNPQKEEWCWFTTEQSNIVEDQQHNLWMIANGKLYKYPANP
jgi:streptogramin lyase